MELSPSTENNMCRIRVAVEARAFGATNKQTNNWNCETETCSRLQTFCWIGKKDKNIDRKSDEFSDSKDFCLFWQALRWSALPWPWDVLLDPENGIFLWLYREILHHCIMAFRWKTSMKLCLSFNVNRTNKYLISWPLLISLRTVDISWPWMKTYANVHQKLEVELNLGNLLPRQSHGRTHILSQRWGFVGHASAKVCAKPGTFFSCSSRAETWKNWLNSGFWISTRHSNDSLPCSWQEFGGELDDFNAPRLKGPKFTWQLDAKTFRNRVMLHPLKMLTSSLSQSWVYAREL